MTDPKKPGVAFWATVALVALLAYPLSFGPACWLAKWGAIPVATIVTVYRPIIARIDVFPDWTINGIALYAGKDTLRRAYAMVVSEEDDRRDLESRRCLPEISDR
jgi:hypothetical protein